MNQSLRLRLTLLYSGLFAILFVLFGALLYGALAHSLYERLDETLVSEADTAAWLFTDEFEEVGHHADAAAREVINDMKLRSDFVAVLEGNRVLAAKPAPTPARGEGPGRRVVERQVMAGDVQYRVMAGASLGRIQDELAELRRMLLIGLPLVLVLAGMGAWVLATRALRPLESVAAQAGRITENTLHTRIEAAGAAAELEVVIESFNDLLSRLDRSFDAMRRFVADASHELRTPISVIRGEADVALSRERPAAEYREALGVVLDESRRLSALVDDLLNLARADSGRVRLEAREFYLNELAAECCRSVRAFAAARGLTLECRPAPDIQYRGDERLLRRMLLNLLDNAIRYTPAGGTITVSLEAAEDDVNLRVADTGIGIASGHAARVFERFYRADEARSRAAGGFGLGLSIVQWIAEAHHGTAACASEPGRGSVFTVTLPATGARVRGVQRVALL